MNTRSCSFPLRCAGLLAGVLSLAACSSAAPKAADAGSPDALAPDAGSCTTNADCAAALPKTTPADCASAKCESGSCVFSAKDEDGDGYPSAHCVADGSSVEIQVGTDCDDQDAKLYPGHAEACSLLPDGKAPSGTVCAAGARSCESDGNVSSCEGTVACSSSEVCSNGACQMACTDGQVGCSDDQQPATCVKGVWQPSGAACPNACVDGACVGTCVPGARSCQDASTPEVCDLTGTWQADPTCAGQACVNGACFGECAPGTSICSPSPAGSRQTCDDTGTWETGTSCGGSTPICLSGACVTCTPGESDQCADATTPEVCDATGTWQPQASCVNQSCVAGACVGACTPGASGCIDATTPGTCDATGTWQPGTACVNQACSDGACVGVCAPGAAQCTGSQFQGGQPQTCSATGEWTNAGSECGSPTAYCTAGACTSTGVLAQEEGFFGLAADTNNVYWSTATAIMRMPEAGGAITTLASGLSLQRNLAIDSIDAYSFTAAGALVKVPLAGGAITTIATGQADASRIAVGSGHVYWGNGAGALVRVATTGGAVSTIATGQQYVYDVALDATNAYFIGWTNVEKVPLAGGTVTTLATTNASRIAVDAINVYWTDGNLMSIALVGGLTQVYASAAGASALAAPGGGTVIFTDDGMLGPTDGSIVQAGGGGSTVLASGQDQPGEIAYPGGAYVYWLDYGNDRLMTYEY